MRRVLEAVLPALAARASDWDPSYQPYDVRERIEIWGSGPSKEPHLPDWNSHRSQRHRDFGPPASDFTRVTYEDAHWEQVVLNLLGTVRPERRKLIKTAIRRAAADSGRVTGDSLPFSDDDYAYLPPNPTDEPPILGEAAADQVRDLWLATWLRELMFALSALLPESRTPMISEIRRALILLALLAEREPVNRATIRPVENDPPPRTSACMLTVLTQTAPHGPDNLTDAKPHSLVRELEVAA